MWSTFKSFSQFLFFALILLVFMIYHQHQLSKISAQKQTGNVSADFETIVYEYKRLLKLKSMPVQKSDPSEFDKLVAQYKQSGVPKKLQEKEINQINTNEITSKQSGNFDKLVALYKQSEIPNLQAKEFNTSQMTAKQTDALPTLVLQKEPFPPPQQKTAVLGAIIQPLETSEIITQADSKSPKKVQIMSIPRGFPNQSDYMTQWNYVSRQLQNVTKVDKPNPYVRWVDRWEPESQVDEGHNQSVPQPLLIYNKVPRSGSGVIRTIIKDLMPKLNFTLDHLPSTNMLLNTYMELDIFQQMYEKAAKALNNSQAFVADCYFNFVDVGVYNLPRDKARPNWINVVREPIERYVSHFYYMSRDWRMQNKVLSPEDAKRFAGVDLDKCLKKGGDPCQFFCLQYEFFCGNSMACKREDENAVKRAMYNADRYFSVLGLTEDLDTTFRLLELYLPKFFKGASVAFRNRSARDGDGKAIDQYRENVTQHPDLSEEAKEILRQHVHFSREIEFYQFATQRFYKQAEQLLKQ